MSNRNIRFITSALVLALAACASTWPGTQRIADAPPGCASAQAPVDEKGFVVIGGIEQWVTVKGDRCDNPVILFISGGPGNPLSPYADAVFGAWASDFTLVQWDQRGAGMTYGRSPPTEDAVLSIQQMRDDGVELAAYLTHRFGKVRRVIRAYEAKVTTPAPCPHSAATSRSRCSSS